VENTPIEIQLQASDPDQEDLDQLVYSATNIPKGAALDSQTGLFSWTPTYLQAGTYTLMFKVTDTGQLSAEQEATITVEDLNRTPVIDPVPAQTVDENSTLNVSVTASDEDTDNTLIYSADNLPEGATFDAASQTLTWTPGFEQAGTYNVVFNVTDEIETVSTEVNITVQNVNRMPEFENIGDQQVDENNTLTFTVNASDADVGSELAYTAADLPEGATFDEVSRVFTWTPGFEQAGEYTVSFTVDDGEDPVSTAVPITVNNVNRLPEFEPVDPQSVSEEQELSFSVSASDEDEGTILEYSVPDLPPGADFADQTFSWKPGFDQAGEYTVSFVASDGEDRAELPVQITVENVNRSPEVSGPEEEDVRAGETLNISYSGNDPDDDQLEFSSSDLPSGAQLDSQSGSLTWTPSDDQVGKTTVTIRASDGALQAEAQTIINVRKRELPTTETPSDTTQENQ
jgi:hypothetical protein